MPRPDFDRQLETLVRLGYPELAGLEPQAFREALAPLEAHLSELPEPGPSEPATHVTRVPWVLVVSADWLPADQTIVKTTLNGKSGLTVFSPDELQAFKPIPSVPLPEGVAYLLLDVDTGTEFLNVTPNEALEAIQARGRSPLTIAEGIALVTQVPETLRKNACFSLLGSRCGDRRVPALWISEKRPKLGWCWAGNPHTWLGSASCASRIGG